MKSVNPRGRLTLRLFFVGVDPKNFAARHSVKAARYRCERFIR